MFHSTDDEDDAPKLPKLKLPFGSDDDDNAPFRPFAASEKHSPEEARSILQRLIDWLKSED